MKKLLLTSLLVALAAPAYADDTNLIATFCKKQWPGDKGVQYYCITANKNYMDWLAYTRKHVFNNKRALNALDTCIADKRPNYRRAFDCYWNWSDSDN